jgi:nitrite reductase/ring-hydroxylating ferredoxin subunit
MNSDIHDRGTGYELRPGSSDRRLVETSFGTPMGELLRRYWHPIALSSDATATPRRIRFLSEDLVLFRDGSGNAGLLYERCAHRGTTLYFGKVEERGIRCCYHGWLFDRTGHCVEQPCEPGGGRARASIQQPWYPVEERYGLIFAYLGPPAKKPVLPRYDILEDLEPGDTIVTDDSSIGTGGAAIAPWNWMQHYDNVLDPYHVPVLHGSFSGTQFVDLLASMPEVTFKNTERGAIAEAVRTLDDGAILRRVTEAVLPTVRIIPDPNVSRFGRSESVGWLMPIDDTHYRIYTALRARDGEKRVRAATRPIGKTWLEMNDDERRAMPGDWEAQIGQGTITKHSEEHLVSSDRGLVLVRRQFRALLDAVERGEDPPGTAYREADALVRTHAGNFREAAFAESGA